MEMERTGYACGMFKNEEQLNFLLNCTVEEQDDVKVDSWFSVLYKKWMLVFLSFIDEIKLGRPGLETCMWRLWAESSHTEFMCHV